VILFTIPVPLAASSVFAAHRAGRPSSGPTLLIVDELPGAIAGPAEGDLTDAEVSGRETGPSTAEIRPKAASPPYRLPVVEHLEGFYWFTEFSLVGGRAIYDTELEKFCPPAPDRPAPCRATHGRAFSRGPGAGMTGEERRRRLAATFDQAADLYQRARPEYPAEVYQRLLEVTGLQPPAPLLEIGCATGKATLPLSALGFPITCLEPGPALAARARVALGPFNVDVVGARFEDWQGPTHHFAMIYAATAWHWLDPEVRYARAATALRPGGYLALWGAGHVIPLAGDPFFEQIQEVYDEIGEGLPPSAPLPRPGELADDGADIEASGLFDVVEIRQYDWETIYDAEGYIDLLNTFSGHIAMEDWQRDRLYAEIRRRLAQRADGLVRRHWGGVLQIARVRNPG
jgi:SAM-dependent methyltransferase